MHPYYYLRVLNLAKLANYLLANNRSLTDSRSIVNNTNLLKLVRAKATITSIDIALRRVSSFNLPVLPTRNPKIYEENPGKCHLD